MDDLQHEFFDSIENECIQWFQQDAEKIKATITGMHKAKNILHKTAATGEKPGTVQKLSTDELREISELSPLNTFLYAFTQNEPDILTDQISPYDKLEHVLLYTRILVTICELELPGFHIELLTMFATNAPLLEHFGRLAEKLFSKRFKTMWNNVHRVDSIVSDMQVLLLQAQRAKVLTEEGIQLLVAMKTLIKNSDSPVVAEREICVHFLQQLELVLGTNDDYVEEYQQKVSYEIYPSYDELKQWCNNDDSSTMVKQSGSGTDVTVSVSNYLDMQRLSLREYFISSLRHCVRTLHRHGDVEQLKKKGNYPIWSNVRIMLNSRFDEVQRHEMIFADVLSETRKSYAEEVENKQAEYWLKNLKVGALLLFTSSFAFDDLIMATVCSTEESKRRRGYVGIEIISQFNAGALYKKLLIMFEAPEFFEPYQKVYNYLRTCNELDFAMKNVIVFGEQNQTKPAYLNTNNSLHTYANQKFTKKFKNLPLNDSQKNALINALTNNFSIIQGPPGTGKTHLSVHLIKTLVEHAKGALPIVLITYTNESLDKLLLKVSAHTDKIVRFGSQVRSPELLKYNPRANITSYLVNPRLKKLYWMVHMVFKTQFKSLQKLYKKFNGESDVYQQIQKTQNDLWNTQQKLNTLRIIYQHYLVRKKHVIAMTTSCASRMNFLFRFLKCKIVIFEEAAEILESHILPCLTPYTEHVIMIGDHKQLKPFSKSLLLHCCPEQQSISLFERLVNKKFPLLVLETQYRMATNIADLLQPTIYEQLKSDDSVKCHSKVSKMLKNLYFVTHSNMELQNNNTSISNTYEVEKVTELARYLLEKASYKSSDLVVLSPYSRQVEHIKAMFSNYPTLCNIRIATVDNFQGLEANIVLVSLVRSNRNGAIGFLRQQHRICVLLSRAKYGLYLIGNMQVLSYCSTWRAVNDKLKMQNAIGTEFPYENSE